MTSTNYTIRKTVRRKIYGIAGAVLTLAAPFFLMLNNADHHLDKAQSLCPFKMLTGFPCPGCGITKSLVYFYEGDWIKSISYHILGPFVVLFCVTTIAVLLTELRTGKEYFNSILYNKKLAYVLGVSLGAYHLVRIFFFIRNNTLDEILMQSIWK